MAYKTRGFKRCFAYLAFVLSLFLTFTACDLMNMCFTDTTLKHISLCCHHTFIFIRWDKLYVHSDNILYSVVLADHFPRRHLYDVMGKESLIWQLENKVLALRTEQTAIKQTWYSHGDQSQSKQCVYPDKLSELPYRRLTDDTINKMHPCYKMLNLLLINCCIWDRNLVCERGECNEGSDA